MLTELFASLHPMGQVSEHRRVIVSQKSFGSTRPLPHTSRQKAAKCGEDGSTLLSWKDSKGFASTHTKKTYKRRRRAGKPSSLLSVRIGWPSYPWAAIWLHEEYIHVGLTANFSSTCEGKQKFFAQHQPIQTQAGFNFFRYICKLETYFRLYSRKPLLHSI